MAVAYVWKCENFLKQTVGVLKLSGMVIFRICWLNFVLLSDHNISYYSRPTFFIGVTSSFWVPQELVYVIAILTTQEELVWPRLRCEWREQYRSVIRTHLAVCESDGGGYDSSERQATLSGAAATTHVQFKFTVVLY